MLANRMMMGAAGVSTGGIGGIDAYTVLYLPMTGADASTTFTDTGGGANCPHTVTPAGDAQVDTAIADPFGGNDGVLLLDGTGDYITWPAHSDFNVGNGDFTIDCWIRPSVIDLLYRAFGQCNAAHTDISFFFVVNTNEHLLFYYQMATTLTMISSTSLAAANTWVHVALARNGTTMYYYVNGVSKHDGASNTNVSTTAVAASTSNWSIGRSGEYDGDYFPGCVSHFRISKGIDRTQQPADPMYNGGTPGDSFTPPTGPYTT